NQAGDTLAKANALLNRVELYILMYDLEMARENCLNAMRTFHKLGQMFGQADACKLMGVIYTKDEDWELAKKYFEESIEISLDCDNLLGLAECYQSYGDFYIEQKKHESALEMLNKSVENFRLLKATRKAKQVEKKIKELATS
ncbi:MAG: tetratricopeptide repeat protein, partial [bacterium]